MALPGFTWNGIRSETWGLYLRSKKPGLLPSTRDIEVVIPGRPGVYDYRTEHDKRTLSLELYAEAPDRATLLDNLRSLARAIDPTRGYARLIFDDEPDREYRVKVTGATEVQFGPVWATFTLGLKMADPYVYATRDTTVQATLTAGGEMAIWNDGSVETGMIVMITPVSGVITDPNFTVNAVTFSWAGQIPLGTTLRVDTGAMTVSLGTQNALAGWSGDWPTLQPGHNILVYGQRPGSGSALITVVFRPRWV